jgi:hypothetical protein
MGLVRYQADSRFMNGSVEAAEQHKSAREPALGRGPSPTVPRGCGRSPGGTQFAKNRLGRCCWLYVPCPSASTPGPGLTALILGHQPRLALVGRRRWVRREFLGDRHGSQLADDFWGPPEEYGFGYRFGNSENLGPHRGLQPSQLTPSQLGALRFFGENRIFP